MASQSITKSYTAAADPTSWLNRIVYISANDTVSLCNTPATQQPIGVVDAFFVNGTDYEVLVCVAGPSYVVAGETTLDADAAAGLYVTGGDDSGGAALDGRAVVCPAGSYYVGRLMIEQNIAAGGLARIYVSPGQRAQAAE